MTRPVDRTRTEESHRGSGVFRLAQTCQGGDLTESNSLRGESVVPDLSKSQRKPLQLYYLIVRACKFHPDLIKFLSSKKNETKNQRKTSSLGTIISPNGSKWCILKDIPLTIVLTISQGETISYPTRNPTLVIGDHPPKISKIWFEHNIYLTPPAR